MSVSSGRNVYSQQTAKGGSAYSRDSLFLIDRLELDGVVGVLTSACGAAAVEVFLDVVPTETTYL